MSELKVIDVDKMADVRSLSGRFYRKSEADKVIAELKADYKEACGRLQTANLIKDEQIATNRHHKYKRCMAMARWCEERYNYLTCLENWQMTDKEYQQVIGDYWDRWHKRWLELAEKFKDKEAK